jgi:hypothetical protein
MSFQMSPLRGLAGSHLVYSCHWDTGSMTRFHLGYYQGSSGMSHVPIPLAVKSSQLAQDFLRGITSRRFTLSESVFLRAVTRPVNCLFTLLLTWC